MSPIPGDLVPWSDSLPLPDPCPFCGEGFDRETAEFYYNGPGSPPSYMVTCGWCGAYGPHGHGRERDDHYGAKEDAIRLWNSRTVKNESGSNSGTEPAGDSGTGEKMARVTGLEPAASGVTGRTIPEEKQT